MKALKIIFCLLISYNVFCQIGIGTDSPEQSAILDVSSTEKGFLPPRLTEAERNAIINPATGLLIYNNTSQCLEIYQGLAGNNPDDWISLCGGGNNGGQGVVTTPPTFPTGALSVSTRTCFDIAESNDFEEGCGSLTLRNNSKSDFTSNSINTQTISISTTIAVTDLELVAFNKNGDAILNLTQPALTDLDASGPNSKTTATVEYKTNLNTTVLGLSASEAYIGEIYLTYKELGVEKQNKITITVKDCECSRPSPTSGWTSAYVNDKGEVYTTGWSNAGALGRSGADADFEIVTLPNKTDGNQPIILETSSGYYHTLALDNEGSVYGWGADNYGQLGQAAPTSNNYSAIKITEIPSGEKAVQVCAGYYNSYILTDNNKIYRAGYNGNGQLGTGDMVNLLTFELLDLNTPAFTNQNGGVVPVPKQIYSTKGRAMFIDQNNKLWITGSNISGANGLNTTAGSTTTFTRINGESSPPPGSVQLPSNYEIAQVVSVELNTVLLLKDESIYIAGDAAHGLASESGTSPSVSNFERLAKNGDLATNTSPIAGLFIANSYDDKSRLFVLTSDNKLYVRGRNAYRSAGVPSVTENASISTFMEVDLSALNGATIKTLKTLDWVTGIVTQDGKIYTAGINSYNNLIDSLNPTYHSSFLPATKPNVLSNFWVN
jgi:alpha-tubulin suppressor-like RCC1 family protein